MSFKNYVAADDYRVEGEKLALYGSLFVLGIIFIILLKISVTFLLIVVAISAGLVKIRQSQLLGNCVKVKEDVFPEVYKSAQVAGSRLTMNMPDIFITMDPKINAFALGFFGRKSVVLNSATVEAMNADELNSILGHEFSHIKCAHTKWLVVTNSVESIKIPVVADIIGVIFMFWSRKSEYTADRGSLIVSRNVTSSMSALAKVAVGKELYEKLNLQRYIEQIRDINDDEWAKLGEMLSSHPYLIQRLLALLRFYKSERYKKITAEEDSNNTHIDSTEKKGSVE